MRTLLTTAAILLLPITDASAQVRPLDLKGDDRAARVKFDLLDYNGDRQLDRVEWNGTAAAFERLDTNRNGYLSQRELERANLAAAAAALDGVVLRRTVIVTSRQRWVDTGIDIRAGDFVTVSATGAAAVTGRRGDIVDPNGTQTWYGLTRAPLSWAGVGTLVGRVGSVEPFVVGSRLYPLEFTYDGRLYLGINDDTLTDNSGQFRATVTVTRQHWNRRY